jgi:hypothetical protein
LGQISPPVAKTMGATEHGDLDLVHPVHGCSPGLAASD